MEASCCCQNKCGNATITFSKSSVARDESFTITVVTYKQALDVSTNTSEKVQSSTSPTYTFSASSDGQSIGLSVSAPSYNGNAVTYNDCRFTSNPPNNASSAQVVVSVQDPTPPGTGGCGSASVTLLPAPTCTTFDNAPTTINVTISGSPIADINRSYACTKISGNKWHYYYLIKQVGAQKCYYSLTVTPNASSYSVGLEYVNGCPGSTVTERISCGLGGMSLFPATQESGGKTYTLAGISYIFCSGGPIIETVTCPGGICSPSLVGGGAGTCYLSMLTPVYAYTDTDYIGTNTYFMYLPISCSVSS